MQCKNVVPSAFSKSMPANVNQNLGNFPQMPFLSNPFYMYGNASMTPMLWGNQNVNNPFAYIYIYPKNEIKDYLQPKGSDKPKCQRPTPKVKVDLKSPEPKVEKMVSKSKASSNKPGPKAIWVPIQK